jgi:hypothetical protein
MRLYEDQSIEDALNVAQEAQNSLNLQPGEHGLEDPLLPLAVKKALAWYKPQKYDHVHHN